MTLKKNLIKQTGFYRNLLKDLGGNVISEKFGINSSWKWYNDPRQFFISLARYKFVAKILSGKKNVLEVGCSDGLNSRIVKQEVEKLDLCDVDLNLIKNAEENMSLKWKVNIFFHDFLKKKLNKKYNAIYLLDVLEHIPKKNEKQFIKNIINSIYSDGIVIFGLPSKEFQKYSRAIVVSGHVNCKTGNELKLLLNSFFFKCTYLFHE
jgi:2-polyprenyl-3-methyl-5-hydroxy-6-metoxy-1,4-benzoquinol methylase